MELVKARGLAILAVTDHDTIAGVDEVMEAGKRCGLWVIQGVELSAKEHHNFYLLGDGFRDGDTELSRLCEQLRAGRDDRKYRIADFLREKGFGIDLSKVGEIAGGEVIAQPHFAQVMVKHGYVSTNRKAFNRCLCTEEFRKNETFQSGRSHLRGGYHVRRGQGVPGSSLPDGIAGQCAGTPGKTAHGLEAGRYRVLLPQIHCGAAGVLPAFDGQIPPPPHRRKQFSWGEG